MTLDNLADRLARSRFTRSLPGAGLGVPVERVRRGRTPRRAGAAATARRPSARSPPPTGDGVQAAVRATASARGGMRSS
ncbi:hypothetical protein [Streptosporangium saharense]|uniref:hypothetical protein n=1 Tax=Streptosporangium saharense TaxID=1706840 RepID=UPI003319CEDE